MSPPPFQLYFQFWCRFPSCLKLRAPFNALCLLDPRNIDMFFEEEGELANAVNTIKHDRVFNNLREDIQRASAADNENNIAAVTEAAVEPNSRRAQLLARRGEAAVVVRDTFEEKVDKEIIR